MRHSDASEAASHAYAMVSAHDHGWVQPVGESVVLELSDEAVDLLLRYHAGRDLAILPLVCHLQGLPR